MIKNTKNFKKCIAFTAIIGTLIAAAATFAARLHSKNIADKDDDFLDDEDDFDTLDFSSISNDTPRDYVSIKINNKID